MASQQYHTRILLMLLISAAVSACNEPAQTGTDSQNKDQVTLKKPTTVPQTTVTPTTVAPTTVTPKPALKLSIEDIENTLETEDVSTDFDRHIDRDSDHQAQILTRKQKDDGIKLSGKLYTDQGMIDTGEYLNSVDGVQLNIEGSFR